MPNYEYKVVPAPKRGLKAKGLKTGEARFANALQKVMNDLGAEGWEYQRTDTLPLEERQGLTGKTTSFQNMLVFRRTLDVQAQAETPEALIEDHIESEQPAEPAAQDIGDEAEPTTLAADKRVNDTLASSGFAFPWASRKAAAKASGQDKKAESDDPQVAAE